MENKIKSEILAGKWNLPPWPEEFAGLMGGVSPEFCMISKIEAQEQELRECNSDREKAAKSLEILSRFA